MFPPHRVGNHLVKLVARGDGVGAGDGVGDGDGDGGEEGGPRHACSSRARQSLKIGLHKKDTMKCRRNLGRKRRGQTLTTGDSGRTAPNSQDIAAARFTKESAST